MCVTIKGVLFSARMASSHSLCITDYTQIPSEVLPNGSLSTVVAIYNRETFYVVTDTFVCIILMHVVTTSFVCLDNVFHVTLVQNCGDDLLIYIKGV